MLGYRGHFVTKSRRYSTTCAPCAPPAATNAASTATRNPADGWGRTLDATSSWAWARLALHRGRRATPPLAGRIRSPRPRAPGGRPARKWRSLAGKRRMLVTKLLLTVPEAAAALAISRSKLYELLAAGVVRSVRIDGSRRVPVEALEAYVAVLLGIREARCRGFVTA